MSDIFPITDVEAEMLHELGWESGFGWENQFDWYRMPSYGPGVWVEDDTNLMNQFLGDLSFHREQVRQAEERERLNKAAPELFEALQDICTQYPLIHGEPVPAWIRNGQAAIEKVTSHE